MRYCTFSTATTQKTCGGKTNIVRFSILQVFLTNESTTSIGRATVHLLNARHSYDNMHEKTAQNFGTYEPKYKMDIKLLKELRKPSCSVFCDSVISVVDERKFINETATANGVERFYF